MKNSREDIYAKINFFKFYCHHLLSNGIDIYSDYYLVNLRSLIIELKSELVNHKYDKQRRLGGMTYFLKEIKKYLDANYFYKKTVSKEIMQLKSSFSAFEQSNEQTYLSTKADVLRIVEMILAKVSSSHSLNDLVHEITALINNSQKVDECYNKVKSLASDYICELLLRGFEYEELREVLTKSTFKHESGAVIDKSEELFRDFIWLPIDNESSTYTFVFKIIGLKLYVKSIKIDDVLFYNPIREDLLRWRDKEEIFSDEIYIMNPEDQELLNGYRSEIRTSDQDYYEIEYTDCHARVKVNASGINQGLLRAKNKLDNLLQILKFNYSISNVKISDLYLVYDHINGNQHLDSVTTNGRTNRKLKLTEVDYYPKGLTDRILNDLTNRNSPLNNILMVNNSDSKENLMKVIYWYNRGQDESDSHVKFVNYWIALEYLVGQNSNNIKTKMLNDLVCVLSQVTFRNELRGLYTYFRNRFFGIDSVMKFPTELANISGFNEFHTKLDPNLLIKNILIFNNHTDDDFIKHKIDFLNKLNSDIKFQKNTIKQLEEKYQLLVSRLYRIRNGLMHSALTGKNDISIYVEWLRYCVVLILNAAVLIDEDKNEVWNYEYAIKIFKEWKHKANKGQFIEFF
ncbi:hypothetical protein MKY48_22825 [Paenibacillus sp. FSL W8-0187]|uniref:hypothetical protein n=1 Tax=Paenibacillus sp. FSL W8-0187 TaxID=2921710 RepID=UPI0030D72AED